MAEFIPPTEPEYFVGTLVDCEAFVTKMNTMMGYPSKETKTMRYSIPREHDSKKGTYIVPLEAVYAPKLKSRSSLEMIDNEMTSTQLTNKTTLDTLKAEGAFPISLES